eukprot:comp22482_c0_seq2/m.55724 comp22482_c0_seq2/g.55724  ORF comp22482_c0_seq2/g.55724 comp22482_c0_seq2/m.55724 type:complete len:264 (+) comp22482_c0_seq2:1256-2047(+)
MVAHARVKVLASKMCVSCSRLHLEDAVLNRQKRHIKGTASEIEDQNVLLTGALLVKTVRDRCRCRLVDDTQHIQAGNRARVLGRLSLRVVEVRRNSDHGVLHSAAKIHLSSLLHLHKHHRRDLLRRELLLLALELNADVRLVTLLGDNLERPVLHVVLDNCVLELAADKALRVEHRVDRVHRDLVLGGVTDETLGVSEGNVRRGRAVTLVVGNDLNAIVLPHTDTRVGCAKVNSDSWAVVRHFSLNVFGLKVGAKLRFFSFYA